MAAIDVFYAGGKPERRRQPPRTRREPSRERARDRSPSGGSERGSERGSRSGRDGGRDGEGGQWGRSRVDVGRGGSDVKPETLFGPSRGEARSEYDRPLAAAHAEMG
eukprot:3064375-Pleurochrysis_carterae.AAC.2